MKIDAKRPELITITINQECDESEITALIKNLEATPSVFRYVCGYRGKVVDMSVAVDLENEIQNNNWSN